jgi:hypothetical protein
MEPPSVPYQFGSSHRWSGSISMLSTQVEPTINYQCFWICHLIVQRLVRKLCDLLIFWLVLNRYTIADIKVISQYMSQFLYWHGFFSQFGSILIYVCSHLDTNSCYMCQVIHVQPHTLFVNRIGQRLSLRQGDITYEEMLYPNDPPKSFLWQSTRELELLKVLCVNHSQCSMVKKSFRLIQYWFWCLNSSLLNLITLPHPHRLDQLGNCWL